MRTRLFGLILCFLSLAAVSAGDSSFKMTAPEKKLLELTNLERKKKDLSPLAPSPLLFKIARAHSENMAKQAKMDHELDGKNPFDRLKDGGYKYLKAGENVGAGDAEIPIADLMKAWMDSPMHRENILRPDFTEVGFGAVKDKKGDVYYTQLFGKPK